MGSVSRTHGPNMGGVGDLDKSNSSSQTTTSRRWCRRRSSTSSHGLRLTAHLERQLHGSRIRPRRRWERPASHGLQETRPKRRIVEARLSKFDGSNRPFGTDDQFEDGASRGPLLGQARLFQARLDLRDSPNGDLCDGRGTEASRYVGLFEPDAGARFIRRTRKARVGPVGVVAALGGRRCFGRMVLAPIRVGASDRDDHADEQSPEPETSCSNSSCSNVLRHVVSPARGNDAERMHPPDRGSRIDRAEPSYRQTDDPRGIFTICVRSRREFASACPSRANRPRPFPSDDSRIREACSGGRGAHGTLRLLPVVCSWLSVLSGIRSERAPPTW